MFWSSTFQLILWNKWICEFPQIKAFSFSIVSTECFFIEEDHRKLVFLFLDTWNNFSRILLSMLLVIHVSKQKQTRSVLFKINLLVVYIIMQTLLQFLKRCIVSQSSLTPFSCLYQEREQSPRKKPWWCSKAEPAEGGGCIG